jgi:hypothetical protein
MQPLDCPNWEYENHAQRGVIRIRVADIIVDLATRQIDTLALAVDTRPHHLRIFRDVAPIGHEYYAGHYRGEFFRCLRFYLVSVPGDNRVGASPWSVQFLMKEMSAEIRAGILALDANVLLSDKQKLQYIVALACHVLVRFFTVHPYANGNGHAGRLLVWGILGRYGYWPRHWPVDPRPPDPPYTELIFRHRNGDTSPLEKYLLQQILAPSA